MQSAINIRHQQYDVFETSEYDSVFFEYGDTMGYSSWIPESTRVSERRYLSIFLRAESRRKFYKREDYDLLTYLGDVGGLLDFILMAGWSLSTVFVSRLFAAKIIAKVYRMQKYLQDMTPYYETNIVGQVSDSENEDGISSSSSSSDKSSKTADKRRLDPTSKITAGR